MKRLISLFLSLCMVLQPMYAFAETAIPSGDFTDIENHWAAETIEKYRQMGMAKGYADGTFRPNKGMKRSEMATFINRYFGFNEEAEENFEDVKVEDWFSSEAAKAKYYEYIEGLEMRPDEAASRMDVVGALSLIVDRSEQEKKVFRVRFRDVAKLSEKDRDNIEGFAMCGYIKGYKDGTFRPDESVSRAEILSILERVLGYIVRNQEDADKLPPGATKITVIGSGIVFDGKTIEGNIYISPGVRGNISFKNTEIKGILELAGGEVHLQDTAANRIVTSMAKGKPSLEIIGGSVGKIETKTESEIALRGGAQIGRLYAKSATSVCGDGRISRTYLRSGKLEMEEKYGYLRVYGECEALVGERRVTSRNDDYKPSKRNSSPSINEDGSVEHPFLIDSIEELAQIGTTEDWSMDKCYKLVRDLDFANASSYEAGEVNPYFMGGVEADGWEPIGTDEEPFSGSFYGNKKTISNLFVGYGGNYQGLFGFTSGAEIADTWLSSIHAEGNECVGGLVGYAGNSTITGSFVQGEVFGMSGAGGIAGVVEGGSIADCYSSCEVSGFLGIGGMVGIGIAGRIENSYARGFVRAGGFAGGILGIVIDETVINCIAYNDSVDGEDESHRVLGADYSETVGGTLYNFAKSSMLVNGSSISSADPTSLPGADIDSMTSTGALPLSRWDFKNIWEIKEGDDKPTFRAETGEDVSPPGLRGCVASSGNETGEILLSAEMDESGSIYYAVLTNGSAAPSANEIKEGLGFAASGRDSYFDSFAIAGLGQMAFYDIYLLAVDSSGNQSGIEVLTAIKAKSLDYGMGTDEDPFKIYKIEDLARVGSGNADQNGNEWGTGDSYELMNDLDFTSVVSYESGLVNTSYTAVGGGEGWNPIGEVVCDIDGNPEMLNSRIFVGDFNGNGHAIKNLFIKRDGENYQGLFEIIMNASVSNLSFAGINVTGNESVGGLAGTALESEIENVHVLGSIAGKRNVGGVFGYVSGGNGSQIISDASVAARDYAGGIAGTMSGGSFDRCYAIGTVTGASSGYEVDGCIGGFAGSAYTETITRCYATGNIEGKGQTGGFIGESYESTIRDCYSTGLVEGNDPSSDSVGGFIGISSGDDIDDCYAVGNVLGGCRIVGGFVGHADSSTISSCASLGEIVTGTSEVLRFCASKGSSILDGNYTNEGMLVNGSSLLCDDAASLSGADLASFTSTGALPLSGWDFGSVWEIKGGAARPTLIDMDNDDSMPPSFTRASAATGDSEGEIDLNASINEPGTIYYAVVDAGNAALTKEEIKYGSGHVADGQSSNLYAYSIEELSFGEYYDIYLVAEDEAGNNSPLTCFESVKAKTKDYGNGTNADPYRIFTIEDLARIGTGNMDPDGNSWNGYDTYILMNDLDFTSASSYESGSVNDAYTEAGGGEGWIPIGSEYPYFGGTFDGRGHSIRHLYINRSDSDYRALFGSASGAELKNILVEDAFVKGNVSSGVLVAYAFSDSSIFGCASTGSVSGGSQTGGLVGTLDGSRLSNSWSEVTVQSDGSYVGGLIGMAWNMSGGTDCIISDSYSLGDVNSSSNQIGGLIGNIENGFEVTDCYSAGNATASNYVGGIAGWAQPTTISACVAYGELVSEGIQVGRIAGYLHSGSLIGNYANASMLVNGVPISSDNASSLSGEDIETLTSTSTFPLSGWDFDETDADGNHAYWKIEDEMQRPVLYTDPDGDGSFEKLGPDDGMLD